MYSRVLTTHPDLFGGETAVLDELSFDEWLADLKVCAMKHGGMSSTEAEDYGKDRDAWLSFYDDGYTPYDALVEDITCWAD